MKENVEGPTRKNPFGRFVIAAVALASSQLIAAPVSLKARASGKGADKTYVSAGFFIPGVTGSIQTRVYHKKVDIYAGGDLDVMFLGFAGWSAVTLMPTATVTLHIPTGGMATPTFGVGVGPAISFVSSDYAFALAGMGSRGDSTVMRLGLMLKAGVLLNIDKGMDIDVQMRIGTGGWMFSFYPQVGMRFAI
ncbi:hypothetical protein K2X33_03835 [bacterium]|nr:hypothetical protein [bacterium]